MKLVILFLVSCLCLLAVTESGSITIPDNRAVTVANVLDLWILTQENADGTLKYPGANKAARRQSYLDGILRERVIIDLHVACQMFPSDCPSDVKAKLDALTTADDDVDTELEATIQ